MVIPVDAPNDDPPHNEPPIVLPLLLLEDTHDFRNAKSENPPPPPPKLEICLGGSNVEDAPPHIHPVLPPPVVAVCIDHLKMWLFEFDHLRITVCLYDWFEDQDRHRPPFG